MADLTANNTGIVIQGGYPMSLKIADGVTVAVGGLVQNEAGFANHWDASGTPDVFLGVVAGGDSRDDTGTLLGETSDDNPPRAHIRCGATLCHLDSVGGSPTVSGVLVYGADSDPDSLTVTDPGTEPVGWIKEFRSATDLDVQLFTPAEYQAGIASGTWIA